MVGSHNLRLPSYVNSRWAHEAKRHIWHSFCVSETPSRNNTRPDFHNLQAISPERQQLYAAHIRDLHFSRFWRYLKKDFLVIWPEQFTRQLTRLSFASLEELTVHFPFESPPAGMAENEQVLIHFLNPHLKSLSIRSIGYARPQLSERFLHDVRIRCKALKQLSINMRSPEREAMSPELFPRVIEDLDSLMHLELSGLNGMSFDVLISISQHQTLESLECSIIKDEWMRELILARAPERLLFPKLQELSMPIRVITDTGLGLLLPLLGQLQSLKIHMNQYSYAPSDDLKRKMESGYLKSFAGLRLSKLVDLTLELWSWDTFVAEDLIPFAESVPNLQCLKIPVSSGRKRPGVFDANGLTDNIMDEFSRRLPDLRTLQLDSQDQSLIGDPLCLTSASLVALGQNCPNLEVCMLSAEIDIEELLSTACLGLFPRLCSLAIGCHSRCDQEAHLLAGKLSTIMPRLYRCSLFFVYDDISGISGVERLPNWRRWIGHRSDFERSLQPTTKEIPGLWDRGDEVYKEEFPLRSE